MTEPLTKGKRVLSGAMAEVAGGAASLEAWSLVRQMLGDMADMVVEDAEDERELLEGLRVVARITGLCAELSVDVDPERPWFFDMSTAARLVGGPNPDGRYPLAMIDGRHRYRVRGRRGTSAYLGFQVLAGTGLTPRRMAAYLSDGDLDVRPDGSFGFVLSAVAPNADELAGDPWVEIPDDASAIVVREYLWQRDDEVPADLDIEPLDPVGEQQPLDDEALALQLTSMAWTIAKLATLHRTIKPELLDRPNELVVAGAAELGAADTTPDNLYLIGTFRLEADEALVLDLEPPDTRYWNVTVESVWHEVVPPRRRRSSVTNAHLEAGVDGRARVVVAAADPGVGTWLDTGGLRRGFVVVRWLDNPAPPAVTTAVVPLSELRS
jgi:hypothetical protein